MAVQFPIWFLLLILCLQTSDNTLISRFRNPNEFVAPEEVLAPEDLEPAMYDDLMQEVPELRRPASDTLRMPFLRNNEETDLYDYMVNDAYLRDRSLDETTRAWESMTPVLDVGEWGAGGAWNASEPTPGSHNASNTTDARRWGWFNLLWRGPRVATCYRCNVGDGKGIPKSGLCHDAFDSSNWQARTLARYFRARCYRNRHHWGTKIETKWIGNYHHEYDRGLIRGCYGWYNGGCYKRWLDVGKAYTARGCRSWRPGVSSGYASHRFRKLEYMLKGKKEACVMSPHASLTPFSRAISLYVRYHICVCQKKYCNAGWTPPPGPASTPAATLLLLVYLLL